MLTLSGNDTAVLFEKTLAAKASDDSIGLVRFYTMSRYGTHDIIVASFSKIDEEPYELELPRGANEDVRIDGFEISIEALEEAILESMNDFSGDESTGDNLILETSDIETVTIRLSEVDVDALNYEGKSALMIASEKGQHEVVAFFINETNARIDFKDSANGYDALQLAINEGHAECVRHLVKPLEFAVDPLDQPEYAVLRSALLCLAAPRL
jgi:hypothetical protein